MNPIVTVVLPTHDHASTLGTAIDSVLEQSFADFELVVIGDGSPDAVREVMARAVAADQRVRFLDKPKGDRHGEVYRHELLGSVESPYIAYQGDDDLWTPHHLAAMLELIEGRDFVHPLPVRIVDGRLEYLPTDLARPECIAWHLQPTRRNNIDLTGVVHTLESYRRLPHGWRAAPRNRWTDHYMWQQYFRLEGFTAATGSKPTTVKFGDVGSSGANIESELADWWARMHRPGFAEEYEALVATATREAAIDAVLSRARLADAIPSPLKMPRIRGLVDALVGRSGR